MYKKYRIMSKVLKNDIVLEFIIDLWFSSSMQIFFIAM